MDKKLKEYLRAIGRKGGKAKSEAKAKAARENGKKHKGGTMKTILLILSVLMFPITVSAKENPNKVRFQLAKALYPNGFPASDIGILDKKAGGEGMVKYRNGKYFDRAGVHEDIATQVIKMNDLEALKLRNDLKK